MIGWPDSATSIAATLKQRGFARCEHANKYRGPIQCGHKQITVTLHIPDESFLNKPEVYIDDLGQLPEGVKPHLEGPHGDRICYAAPGTIRLDPYDQGRSILAVLEMAQKALEDSFAERALPAIANEYAAYWRGAAIRLLDPVPKGESSWLRVKVDGQPFLARNTDRRARAKPDAIIACVDSALTPTKHQTVPSKIMELSDWWERNGLNPVLKFSSVKQHLKEGRLVFAKGKNACLGVRLETSPRLKGERPGSRFTRAILEQVTLEHVIAHPSDISFIARRCIGSADSARSPLAGVSIGLIGCGTIGSHLASFLVRSGAGSDKGTLHLVDPEFVAPGNLGRHTANLADIGLNKAAVVGSQIEKFHPRLNYEVHEQGVEHIWNKLRGCKIIIDASGVENVSEWINWKHIAEGRKRNFIYSWIVQDGAAVQTFVARAGGDFACYRCLRPDLASPSRVSPLKDVHRTTKFEYGTCGDGAFVPFSVGTSVVAASLTLEAVTAILSTATKKNLWTRVTDFELAKAGCNQDRQIGKADGCPACSKR
ncbi:hypothetical protein E5163_02740 [Marinicauda algicola]|uniref:Uncharacterized protein n=1 Tax=Marinicauda algicola TaxID=2029849 RepID=A0A4S2H452_9PROT|nr:ThiF family adenylyltransferase [Marinicauda algicola]TGY90062.1 hypothetical protein E5163_02740 [Marinicauda algicola]